MGAENIWLVVCFIALLVISQMTVNKLNESNQTEDTTMNVKLTKRISKTVSGSLSVAVAIGVNLLSALLLL